MALQEDPPLTKKKNQNMKRLEKRLMSSGRSLLEDSAHGHSEEGGVHVAAEH